MCELSEIVFCPAPRTDAASAAWDATTPVMTATRRRNPRPSCVARSSSLRKYGSGSWAPAVGRTADGNDTITLIRARGRAAHGLHA